MSRSALSRAAWAVTLFAATTAAQAKPQWLRKAQMDGFSEIRSCASCHASDMPSGGPWNDRGNWLRAEKERRHAGDIDVMWLKDYPKPK